MRTNPLFLSGIFLTALLLSACNTSQSSPHWTYEGEEGPAHWEQLDPSYAVCGTGKNQSPIDIASPLEQDLTDISFHYQPSKLNILNNGHTVQVNYDTGSYIEFDNTRYDLRQFHYHAPSEHTINGESFPSELHLVHQSAEGSLAVVGVLLNQSTENAAYQPFISHLPAEKTDVRDVGVAINAMELLPGVHTTFRYSGSLTTPPCTENVSWLLMTTPVGLSEEQLGLLDSLFEGGNNRPVQPINARAPVEDSTP